MPDELSGLRAQMNNLTAEVAKLQERMRVLEAGSASSVAPFREGDPRSKPQLESRLGLTVVNRVGALTLAIGIIFFFKYAADNQWIGASGRVGVGLLTGLLLIFAAEWLGRREQRVFSQGIGGCGLATIYTSLYASFAYYQLVPEPGAYVALIAVCALAVGLSLRYKNPAIAALGFAGGLLTPILLTSGSSGRWINLPYLLLLDLTCIATAVRQHWPALIPSVGGLTLFGAWSLFDSSHPGWFVLFAFAVAAVHLTFALRMPDRRSSYNVLYLTAHACLILALLREMDLWALRNALPADRRSLGGELDSMVLGIYGVAMLTYGMVRRLPIDRALGLSLLGLLTAKLYLWDIWFLTRFYRTTAFVALGALLLSASYLYSRWKSRASGGS